MQIPDIFVFSIRFQIILECSEMFIERGLNFVSADLLEKLATSIDVPVYYLFVNQREITYNDNMLSSIDEIVENKLTTVINEIKAGIRGR